MPANSSMMALRAGKFPGPSELYRGWDHKRRSVSLGRFFPTVSAYTVSCF